MRIFMLGRQFMARTRGVSLALLAVAAMLAPVGAAAQSDGQRYTVRVGSSGEESFENKLAYQVARANGYFDEQGIEIQDITLSGSGAAVLQPLAAGQIDVGFLSLSTTLQAISQGRDVRLGASTQIVNTWLPIISVQFLREHDIDPAEFQTWSTQERWEAVKGSIWAATTPGGLHARAIGHLAGSYGLDPENDISIVAIPGTAAMITTLRSGRIHAFMASSPENANLVEEGVAVHVLTRDELIAEAPLVAYARNAELIINNQWFSENEEAGRRFFTAYQKGADYIAAHTPDEVAALLVEVFPDYALERATQLVEEEWGNTPPDSKATIESLQAQIDFALATGAIDQPVAVEDAYNFDFLPEPNADQAW
jgi:NitT/TauT family transport system substrate-binding protein